MDASDTSRLVVWRHGTSESNERGIYQGSLDSVLTEAGRREAQDGATVLRTYHPVAIVTSDLQRAEQTAQALEHVTGVVAVMDPRFRELYAGTWQGLTKAQIADSFPDELQESLRGGDVRRGGGESMSELQARVRSGVDEIFYRFPVGTVVIVTHSVAARALLGTLLEMSISEWAVLGNIQNGKWSTLEKRLGRWFLESHNVSNRAPTITEEDWLL